VSSIELEHDATHRAMTIEIAKEQDNRGLSFVIEVSSQSVRGELDNLIRERQWQVTGEYGVVYWDEENKRRAIKVRMVTNSQWICQQADRTIVGRRIARTKDNRTIREMVLNGTILTREISIVSRDGKEAFANDNDEAEQFWDNLSGKQLDARLVKKARQEEMKEFQKHQVYKKVDIQECWDNIGKEPIGTRWVDINMGDDVNPEYRLRLVAQEIKHDKREDLFAATPPLEAKKALLSMAMTEGIGYRGDNRKKGFKLEFIDVRRAYFHAKARRLVYVKLPPEDNEEGNVVSYSRQCVAPGMLPRIGKQSTWNSCNQLGFAEDNRPHVHSGIRNGN